MVERKKKILVNRYTILVSFIIIVALAFRLIGLISYNIFKANLPYDSLVDQIDSLFGFAFKGMIIHYALFTLIAVFGWRYTRKNNNKSIYMPELQKGFFYSTLFMFVLGIFYLFIVLTNW